MMHPVEAVFKTIPAPRPVVADLVQFDAQGDQPEYWTIRLYRDDFDNNSGEDRMAIFNWVSELLRTIRIIEPNCWVEVYERAPR